MAYCVKIGRLNVGGGQALLKIVREEKAELATHDGYPLLPTHSTRKTYKSDSDL